MIDWPYPPHYERIPEQDPMMKDLSTIATVVHRNGKRTVGKVLRIDTGAEIIDFRAARGDTNALIPFSQIHSLHFKMPIGMRRLDLSAESALEDFSKTQAVQRFSVRFKDQTTLDDETMGYVAEECGLFLFLVSAPEKVHRMFIPADVIDSYQIGEQLGKLLVERNLLSMEEVEAGLAEQNKLRERKLGDYLQIKQLATQEQIEKALVAQKNRPQLRLGEALLQEEVITKDQLELALQAQSKDRTKPLGDILVNMGMVSFEAIKRVLAQKVGIPFVGLENYSFQSSMTRILPGDLVRKYVVMPLYHTETRIVVAMENPLMPDALKEISFVTRLAVDPVMASGEEIRTAIDRIYGPEASGTDISELVSQLDAQRDIDFELENRAHVTESDNLLVRLVNKIIIDAYVAGASDIHIESMRDNKPTRVRFRKDGIMSDYSNLPANFRNAVVSRIKIMSRLDISEKRHSQDGKINFEQFGPVKLELRVVTIPTTDGVEDVVMRILAPPKAVSLGAIGLAEGVLDMLQQAVTKPHGLLFVCGPTGSGKTTTLHALLSYINTPERKIWTVEDPIEITQDGLRQVQVQQKAEWTFPLILRSFLRADPDVIMVGETRDKETAHIVIEASLTGHLVLSTMHTNSAVESVIRLLDFGLDPYNFGDALIGVVGQRLARRLCQSCRRPVAATEEQLAMLAHEYCADTDSNPADVLSDWRSRYQQSDGSITIFQAVGCKLCNETGYKGRVGIHEFLRNTSTIKRLIHTKASVPDIQALAMKEGMRTLRQDGIEKIFSGVTDWEQVKVI
ncbi:GspE/PulE family protein [Noviherbaspirillum galbum]|uniref:Flp pilus assembly complex ATPase component n=1 Tax=Noviherbaspirillum galbum TaxID=2709383 RepID=A0A6B3SNF1_9BURK|nr:ATPase, T2SS/T4P/T4SS family [Noviherbaspirillum galbum]NEX62237.1 Flp pilus assembly complex ATPase component [Noviherbaspirillum galbum]